MEKMVSTLSFKRTVAILGLLIACCFLISISVGAYSLSLNEIIDVFTAIFNPQKSASQIHHYLLIHIRLPRVLFALTIGAGLAIAGAAIQAIFRNPLADPGLIGVSSGAMFFAVCFIVFSQSYFPFISSIYTQLALALSAFTGGLITTYIVYKLAFRSGNMQISTMLLAGIAIAALFGGLTGLIIFYADERQLRDITFWSMGSLSGAAWGKLALISSVIIFGSYQLMHHARQIEIMQLGDAEAKYLGVDTEYIKKLVIVLVSLIVGTCVAFSGMIGFIGLIVPHLSRIFFKNSQFSHNIVYTFLLGALILTVADTAARTIIAPAELPIGILTSILGAPFFLWLLINTRNKF